MLKGYKKWVAAGIIGTALIFSLLWSVGVGNFSKYQYGNTAVQALMYFNQKNSSTTDHIIEVATVDVSDDEKFVLYINNSKISLTCGLVKRMGNNKWMVAANGDDLPFHLDPSYEFKPKPQIICTQEDLKEFRVSYGIIFDRSIEKITVGEKEALLLRKEFENPVWYYLDKSDSSNTANHSKSEVKAYDKNGKLIYSGSVLK